MAYLIVRGSEKQGGYVSMVDKGRVNGEVRTKKYICGLGSMSMTEFKAFQTWAHSFSDQEERKSMVLSSGRAVSEKEESIRKISEHKQKKTTVKQVPTTKKVSEKVKIGKHYPVPVLKGYKGRDKHKTHTQIMRERETERKAIEKSEQKHKKIYEDITPAQRKTFIKELEQKRIEQINIRDEWEIKSLGGGLYFGKSERAHKARAESEIKRIDGHLKELKRGK